MIDQGHDDMKPNVCKHCHAVVGPESVPHRCAWTVGPFFEFEAAKEPPGTVRHTTRNGKGVVGRLYAKRQR